MQPEIEEIFGQDYQHRLHRMALPLYLLPQAGVLGDTPEVATMKPEHPDCPIHMKLHAVEMLKQQIRDIEESMEEKE